MLVGSTPVYYLSQATITISGGGAGDSVAVLAGIAAEVAYLASNTNYRFGSVTLNCVNVGTDPAYVHATLSPSATSSSISIPVGTAPDATVVLPPVFAPMLGVSDPGAFGIYSAGDATIVIDPVVAIEVIG